MMPAASELPMYSSIASRSWLRKGVELSIERGGSREQVDGAVIGPARWSGGRSCLAEDLAKIMVGWWNPCQVWSGTSGRGTGGGVSNPVWRRIVGASQLVTTKACPLASGASADAIKASWL